MSLPQLPFKNTTPRFIDSIQQTIKASNQKIDSFVEVLFLIAVDSVKTIEVRKVAIDLLLEINTKKTLQFLVDNVGQIYFKTHYFTADNEFKPYYAFTILSKNTRNNWQLIPIIIHSISAKKNDLDLITLLFFIRQNN